MRLGCKVVNRAAAVWWSRQKCLLRSADQQGADRLVWQRHGVPFSSGRCGLGVSPSGSKADHEGAASRP